MDNFNKICIFPQIFLGSNYYYQYETDDDMNKMSHRQTHKCFVLMKNNVMFILDHNLIVYTGLLV